MQDVASFSKDPSKNIFIYQTLSFIKIWHRSCRKYLMLMQENKHEI